MNSLCLFCSSHLGYDERFADAARAMGALLARCGIRLVYGGGARGLMGAAAAAALKAGGEVLGIIPERLNKQVEPLEHIDLIVVKTMNERKETMFLESDGFAALPGGIGTLEEIMEMYTLLQLGFTTKPVGLLNTLGYYDKLLGFLSSMHTNGMLPHEHLMLLKSAEDPEVLLEGMLSFQTG